MATSVVQLLAHPGAKDLRLNTLVASLPPDTSEIEKTQVIANELLGYLPHLENETPESLIENFSHYYSSHLQHILAFARSNFLYSMGHRLPLFDSPDELRERVSTWLDQNRERETLAIYLPFANLLPPELGELQNLRSLDLCATRISFFPYFLKTLPKLEIIVMSWQEPPPRMPHGRYPFSVTQVNELSHSSEAEP